MYVIRSAVVYFVVGMFL